MVGRGACRVARDRVLGFRGNQSRSGGQQCNMQINSTLFRESGHGFAISDSVTGSKVVRASFPPSPHWVGRSLPEESHQTVGVRNLLPGDPPR